MDIRFIAKTYIDAGWGVVPLVKGEKRASTKWSSKTYTPSDFQADDGIAGKCGEPSGWRVDVDLDSPEAIAAAKRLLPHTGLVHGRPGKPDSHYWYFCEGIKTTQFTDIKDGSGKAGMLVEIRSTGGYTALPPSGHPSGDTLAWAIERAPLLMDPETLYAAVRDVAIASLVARHWPGAGVRHEACGHLAGFLVSAGVPAVSVCQIIEAAATLAQDADVRDRVNFAANTCAKHKNGQPVTGGPRLAASLGDAVVAKLRAWLKLADTDALEEMNAKHFWVRMGKDDVIGREDDPRGVVFQRVKSLYSEYANRHIKTGTKVNKRNGDESEEFKPIFQAWLESPARRSYRSVVFSPPPFTADPQDYNLWTGFAVTPKDGECPRFLEHLRRIICSGQEAHYQYLLDLLAITMQQPGVPTGVATVLRGLPGTGKGTFIRALGRIFGPKHFAHLDRVKDLVDFNAMISGKVIVFADEAFWAGDKREVGALKRIITEPTIRITRKGIDSNEERNCLHLFMASNEDWVVPAQARERRFFALNVSSARIGDTAYFDSIEAELAAGGLEAFLYGLLQRPVTFDLIRNVPRTDELRAQQAQSLPPVMEWWQDCLYEGRIGLIAWSDWVPVAGLYEQYIIWCNLHHARVLSKIEFGRRMAGYFSTGEPKSRKVNGEVCRCLPLRPLAEARRYFDEQLASPTHWGADETPVPPSTIPF